MCLLTSLIFITLSVIGVTIEMMYFIITHRRGRIWESHQNKQSFTISFSIKRSNGRTI